MIKIISIDSNENPKPLNMHVALAGLKGVLRCAVLNNPQPLQIINKQIYAHRQLLLIETMYNVQDSYLMMNITNTFKFIFGECDLGIAIKDENEKLVAFNSQGYLEACNK